MANLKITAVKSLIVFPLNKSSICLMYIVQYFSKLFQISHNFATFKNYKIEYKYVFLGVCSYLFWATKGLGEVIKI